MDTPKEINELTKTIKDLTSILDRFDIHIEALVRKIENLNKHLSSIKMK